MIYSHSQIWTPETINDIHARADGEYSLSGFRTFRKLPSFDELVFLAAGLTRFPLEGYKEKSRTETTLGPRCSKPLVIDLPIYVASGSRLPMGARASLAVGSRLANTALSVGGTLLPEERKVSGRLIYEVADHGKPTKSAALTSAGAIQVGVDQSSAESVRSFIREVRGGQEHRVPVFIRMGAGRVRDEVRLAVKAGADGIVLLGLDTPPISDPTDLRQYCRVPMIAAIGLAREALQENKALGEVSLVAGSGILTGADAAKALALGADAIAIQESALVAMGSSALSRRERGGPTSEAERGGERVAKYINSMIMEVALLARSLGKGDVHSLEFEDLAALTLEASLISGVKLAGE